MIKCNNLALGYNGKKVIENISFDINKNDYLVILGENGVGKSTLMKTLLGLIPHLGGEIIFNDEISSKDIGYLPQQSDLQKEFPALVKEIVLSGTLANCKTPFYTKKEKQILDKNLQLLKIEHLKNACYKNLSGGQQQRVLLARALSASNKILLLDEPITGLDPKAIIDFYDLTKELNKQDIAIIMISHDIKSIEFCKHVLYIDKEKCFYGTKDEFKKSQFANKIKEDKK